MRVCAALPFGPAVRLLALLLTLSPLALISACDRQQSGAPAASSSADTANPHEIARRLIKRTIEDRQDGHAAVEIDYELLRDLTTGADKDTGVAAFRDPLLAAWLFAPHIGVPGDAVISIEQASPEAEEASGLFIAVAVVNAESGSMKMRLVSEPGADGKPTIWVLNDYDR